MSLSLGFTAHADAFIYWAEGGTDAVDGSIGRANLDGTGVDKNFIPDIGDPCGVAVDSEHIYWAAAGTNSIGRANLDGTEVSRSFIAIPAGTTTPCGPAVDGAHIWWASLSGTGGQGAIGRAKLDGTSVEPTFFNSPTNASNPLSVTTSGNLIFWSNFDAGGPSPITPSIARAGIDGTPPPALNFVPFTSPVFPTWLVANGSHLYSEASFNGGAGIQVERRNLDGTNAPSSSALMAVDGTGGLALNGDKLYFADQFQGTIGRSNLDGTSPDFAFIRGAGSPFGLAVDSGVPAPVPVPVPSNEFTFGKPTLDRKSGKAQLVLTLPDPGTVTLSGTDVKPATVTSEGGSATLPVAATGERKRKLRKKGKVKLNLAITFTPTGGTANTETTKVKLIRK